MERFGVSDVDELDGFCRPTKKEQEAIRRLVGFRYSQKDRFLLISGFIFWILGYILHLVGLCIHADFVQWMLLVQAIAFMSIIGSRSILVKKIIFSHGMYQVLPGTAEKIAFSGKIMAKFRSENGVLLDPLIPIVTNGKQNIKAGDPVLLVYEETTDMRFVIKHEREGFV